MTRFSLRTFMLTVAGLAILFGLIVSGGMNPTLGHLLLVLAFAIPGGSYGFDLRRSSRGIVLGTTIAAVAGTILLSAVVLGLELLWQR